MTTSLQTVKLILVRHGISKGNIEQTVQGNLDVPITPQGEQDMHAVGRKLRFLPIATIYSSALQRAWRSAEIIASYIGYPPVIRTPLLNGKSYGVLQGMTWQEAERTYGKEQMAAWLWGYDARPPGGESSKDAEQRFLRCYNREIAPQLRMGENIVVVSHMGILRTLAKRIENLDDVAYEALDIKNATPRVYSLDMALRLRSIIEV